MVSFCYKFSYEEETLGQRIRAQCIRLGMTQEELAERLYVKKSTISYYETDKDDFVRKYIRKDIKRKLTSFRIMFIL